MKTKFKFVSKTASQRVFLIASALCVLCGAVTTASAGSLWREAVTDERGMYADKRARRLGDIVTVLFEENFVATNEIKFTDSRNPTGNANGLGSQLVNSLINSARNKQTAQPDGDRRKFPTNLLPQVNPVTGLNVNPTSSFSGAGKIENKQTLTASMAVQVIDVLPNGNLVIEGIHQLSFGKERQFASLRGIIRQYDVVKANTVRSDQIADARIDLVAEGALSNSQKKGWLQRLDEKITPY